MDDFKRFKTSVEEVTENMEETARELELEVESEDVLNCYYLMIKTWTDEKLSLMDGQRKWFLESESTAGKNAVKTWNDNKWFRLLHKFNWLSNHRA